MVVKPNDKIGILVSIITCIVFGLYPPTSRAAYAEGANVVFVIWLTTLVRTVLLVAYCFATRQPLFKGTKSLKMSFIGGVCQSISIIGIISALAFLPGPVVLIIVFTHTMMLLFFMAWRKEIKLDRITLCLTFLALVGLGLVLDFWNATSSSSWIGYGLAFVAAFITFLRFYINGHQVKTRNPAVVGAETFIIASLCLAFLGFWQMPVMPASLVGWGWACLSALSLGGGTFGMFYAIALLGAFRCSLYSKVEPIFTSLFSVLFLGEYLKVHQYLGIAVVLGSLIAYQLVENKKAKRRKPALEIS